SVFSVLNPSDLPGSFNRFVLAAVDVPQAIQLNVHGVLPQFNLSGTVAQSIRGTINLPDAAQTVFNIGSKPFVVNTNARIVSAGTLLFANALAPVINDGMIQATGLSFGNTGGFSFFQNDGTLVGVSQLMLPVLSSPQQFTFVNNKGSGAGGIQI